MANLKSGMEKNSCKGCRWYLGGGCCRINAEAECREGGGFELYESGDTEADSGDVLAVITFLISLIVISALFGIVVYKLALWLL